MYAPNAFGARLNTFQFVYNVANAYGGPPQVQERVFATFGAGKSVEYYKWAGEFVELRGILHVELNHDPDGAITSVFQMDVESVRSVVSIMPMSPPDHRLEGWSTLIGIVGGIIMAYWIYKRLIALSNARRRCAEGHCPACGYDIRATPVRCPECGTRLMT